LRNVESMKTSLEDEEGPIPAAINILDVLRGMRKRRLLIGGMTLLAMSTAFGLVTVVKPVYTTEAQVLVGNLETPFDRVQGNITAVSATAVDDREIASQIAVLKSDDLGRRVVAALKLADDPHYNVMLKGLGWLTTIKMKLGFANDPRLMSPEQRALDTYNAGLIVYPIPISNVIAIKVSSADPAMTAKVANTLAETYVNFTRESTAEPTERARRWLSQQIDSLRGKVAASDAAVEQFRTQAGLLQGAASTLGSQQLSELNSQITLAEAAKTDARSRADSIRSLLASKGSVDASADVLASVVIQSLKQQQTDAMKMVAELSAVYLPSHPKMIAAQKQLDNINRRIRSEALKIVDGLQEQADIAEAREASLRKSLDQLKNQASGSNLDDVKLKALEREAQANRALLETMLARYAEATARLDPGAQPGFARVIETADVPAAPSFPKTGPMVLLITIAGLGMGLGLAFLLEMMAAAARLNNRLLRAIPAEDRTPQDETAAESPPPDKPEQAAAVTPVATGEVVPATTADEHTPAAVAQLQPTPVPEPALAVLPAARNPHAGPAAGAVAPIVSWFMAETPAHGAASLAITSLGGGPGDTSVAAVGLARALAARERRVIIVDLSGGGSWLQQLCGAADGPGLADLVTGAADFTKVIIRDSHSSVHLLRFGADHSDRARGQVRERLTAVLAALARSYETIVVHLGEAGAETPAMVRLCGAAVVLAPATRLSDVTVALAALRRSGFRAGRHVLIGPPSVEAASDAAPVTASAERTRVPKAGA
jgi:polysaccharide biosynthesis transport protein